jgi:hypothetical protein
VEVPKGKKNNEILDKSETEVLYEMFGRAEIKLLKVISKNSSYARAYFYLGNLYSWRAYYEEDESEEGGFQHLARKMYTMTANKATLKPYESNALSYFGLGLVHYRQYIKAKKHNKGIDAKLLEKADQNFIASTKKSAEFYFARAARALVYNEKADLLKEPKDRKQREYHINRAIQELHHAKATAAALKDIESLKWLNRKLLELEFKKRTGGEPEEQGLVE